jgi:hypothetical protein
MGDVVIDVGLAAAYAYDPHVLIRYPDPDGWTLLHPEGCPVSMLTAWDAETGGVSATAMYECPAGLECWHGDGPPEVSAGVWLVRMRIEAEGLEWEVPVALGDVPTDLYTDEP